jgi:2-keto-3-deoxy-L-rhamnonate aldolase RhmA
MLIALVETARGVENVDAIAAVNGIDVVWVGHYDLTASMGIPGQFDNPRFLSALERIVAASKRHGKANGFMVSNADEGRARFAQGFRVLCYLGDVWLYQQALTQGISALRAGIAPRPGTEPRTGGASRGETER